jgi:hypothetical protein
MPVAMRFTTLPPRSGPKEAGDEPAPLGKIRDIGDTALGLGGIHSALLSAETLSLLRKLRPLRTGRRTGPERAGRKAVMKASQPRHQSSAVAVIRLSAKAKENGGAKRAQTASQISAHPTVNPAPARIFPSGRWLPARPEMAMMSPVMAPMERA